MRKLIFLLLLSLIACKSYKNIHLNSLDNLPPPPGTVEIAENIFVDQTEVTNFHWLEYSSWLKRAYGKDSEEYKSSIPNQKVWKELNENYAQLDEAYLNHPAYRDYPVVGISYKQAQAYSQWRSDRVMHFYLIQKGLIEYPEITGEKNVFTIEKYFKGQYLNYQPSEKVKFYPVYSLLDSTTFYTLNLFSDSVNVVNNKSCKNKEETKAFLMNCTEYKTDSLPYGPNPTLPSSSWCKKTTIHHLKGNVREMTNIEGQFYGLSFIDSCDEEHNKIRKDENLVNSYTGFRNMCRYKEWGK